MDEQSVPAQSALTETSPTTSTEPLPHLPLYFSVTSTKLIVMSLCTLSLYQAYWFYMNWRMIKERDRPNILPVWRAIFSPFYCYQCFKTIDQSGEALKLEGVAAGSLAVSYILISLLGLLPTPYWLLSMGTFVSLVPVQATANDINMAVSPGHDRNARFTGWNILGIILSIPVWVMLLTGAFSPSPY